MAFKRMPPTMRAGLIITGAGGVLDIGYHVLTMPSYLGDAGHGVTLLGMLITIGGLVTVALRASHNADLQEGELT
ncbi:MAG: hypothetical protein ACRDKF_04295 [Actinomycetota bacterium]